MQWLSLNQFCANGFPSNYVLNQVLSSELSLVLLLVSDMGYLKITTSHGLGEQGYNQIDHRQES